MTVAYLDDPALLLLFSQAAKHPPSKHLDDPAIEVVACMSLPLRKIAKISM